ncbi:class I SAM-dependent methyltransferase [Stakelama pacifica]|uniref:Putative methyltransferase n=1 Tax=Stakelama pacifica TaxID=517720 RepID=A0A4R6FL75_9SPHN|nr:class I SAM-dependent methyltransferase [Stakelama pacifica]TDN82266.1 putative methyltransferase [Stakelama pacifica]GGO95805.1 methyltransferase [Stakelama pacifica]
MRLALIAAAVALALPLPAAAQVVSKGQVGAALFMPGRPADAVKLDADRKPAEVLNFLGLKKGDVAADIMAGSGYYSEIMARLVGPKGKVVAYEPTQFYDEKAKASWHSLIGREPNVSVVSYPFDKFAAPADTYDFVMLHMVYHDQYWESAKYGIPRSDPAVFVKTLYAAMKPGGIVGVVDHVANPNDDTRATVEAMHRIDPAVVKADFEAAGFVLEDSSDVLSNPDDAHDKSVFDPAIRGHTDRIVYRFRKPG